MPPDAAPCRALEPTDRLLLADVTDRTVGTCLLLASPGPWRDVERLTGSGPLLWRLLGEGLDLEGVARAAAWASGVATSDTRSDVIDFATTLVSRGLARPA